MSLSAQVDGDNYHYYDFKYLFVLDRPLEESFAGLTCEQAVVVAGHLEGQKSESDSSINEK